MCLALFIPLVLLIHAASSLSFSPLPPAPSLNSIPLPAKLAGGLFLFQTSVKSRDKELSKEILIQAEDVLRRDPLISMELGTGLEAGGVFSSSSSIKNGVHQLVMEFQLNGGNSWAQCRCHGVKYVDGDNDRNSQDAVELISLSVSNMDAAFNGGWAEVTIPKTERQSSEEDKEKEYEFPYTELKK